MAEATGTQRETANLINQLTGVMNTQAMGISPTQRAVEQSMVFFSPQYTRAALALVGNLMDTGKSG